MVLLPFYSWQSSQRWSLVLLFQARDFPTLASGNVSVGYSACVVAGSEQLVSATPGLRCHCHVATVSPRGL